jgi:hypothetical protein
LAGTSVVFSDVVYLCDESYTLRILAVKAMTAIGELYKIPNFHCFLLFYMYIIAEFVNSSRKKMSRAPSPCSATCRNRETPLGYIVWLS